MRTDILTDVAAVDASVETQAVGQLAAVLDGEVGVAPGGVDGHVAAERVTGTCFDTGSAFHAALAAP